MATRKGVARRTSTLRRGELRSRARAAERYVRTHRRTGASRVRLGLLLRAFVLGGLLGLGILLVEQSGNALVSVATSVGDAVSRAAAPPVIVERAARPAAPAESVAAAPILDPLEPARREPRLVVSGRLPSYVLGAGERPRVELTVNGALAASPAIDERGRFSATLALNPGPNVIVAATLRGGERVSGTPRHVTLDTVPPALLLSEPKEDAQVDGAVLRVVGSTEVTASVTVNGHAVSVLGDGSFEDLLEVKAGNVIVEVIARDAAGNETRRRLSVTVKEGSALQPEELAVAVTLDRAKAEAGTSVIADVVVSDRGGALRDASVNVSVGLAQVGAGRTDASGKLRVEFKAPSSEGVVQVTALASARGTTGRGAAALEVAAKKP